MKHMVEKVGNLRPSFICCTPPSFLESIESPPSDDSSPTCEWALVGVIGSNQMRTEARKAELKKIKQRKIEHGMLLLTINVLSSINIFFSLMKQERLN